jgi:hypothetical protein
MNINVDTQLSAPSNIINDAVYKKLIQWTAVLVERIKSEWGNRSNISDWEKDIDFYVSPMVGNIMRSHLSAGGLGAWIAEYGSGSLIDKDSPYYESYINSDNYNRLRESHNGSFTGRDIGETVYSPDGTSYQSTGRAKGLNLESGSKFKESYIASPPMHIIEQEVINAMPEIMIDINETARSAIVTYIMGGVK